MMPIKRYMANGKLPGDAWEANYIKKNASRYTFLDRNLFRFGYSRPLLICVDRIEVARIMTYLHEGIFGNHIEGRTLMITLNT